MKTAFSELGEEREKRAGTTLHRVAKELVMLCSIALRELSCGCSRCVLPVTLAMGLGDSSWAEEDWGTSHSLGT